MARKKARKSRRRRTSMNPLKRVTRDVRKGVNSITRIVGVRV